MAYLCDTSWDDGSARETTTVLVFVEAGAFKVAINDRALARSAFLSADSLLGLLDAAELALREEELDWRAKKATPGKGRR